VLVQQEVLGTSRRITEHRYASYHGIQAFLLL